MFLFILLFLLTYLYIVINDKSNMFVFLVFIRSNLFFDFKLFFHDLF